MIYYNIPFLALGGISLVLYGIHLYGINLQKILGSRLEGLLKKAKGNPLKGLLIGTGITAAIHNSGTTSVMLISLIAGSFMELSDSIPVILGANIGSTLVILLASLQMGSLAFIILAAGVLTHLTARCRFSKQLGEAVAGFGLIFIGAQFIFDAAALAAKDASFLTIIGILTATPLSSLFCGTLFTFAIQSASVTSILTISLGASGIIDLPTAIFMILGINLGSSLKAASLALRGRNFSGRLALIHLMSSLLGISVALIFFHIFNGFVGLTSNDIARQIANSNTLFNILVTILFLPLVPSSIRLVKNILPTNKSAKDPGLAYLDRRLICTPSASLAQVNRAVIEMLKISYEMLESTRLMYFENRMDLAVKIQSQEDKIDHMTEMITDYTVQISQQDLSKKDKMKMYSMLHILADTEHLCDHIVAISQIFTRMKNDEVIFSVKAQDELTAVYGKLRIMHNLVIKTLREDNARLANEITEHENKVDEIIKRIADSQAKRIQTGKCTVTASKYFSEILYNLERIGDHYDNIAYAVIDRLRHKERNPQTK